MKFNETFFICKCSNVSSLNLNRYPLFYQKSIQAWTKFLQCVQKVEIKTDILHARLFRNCNTTFQNKPLIFFSFLRSNIKTIQDIWDENSKQFIDCDLLYSKLIDRRNCISEYSKIKKCIPKDYLKFLKNENNDIDNKTKSRNKMKLLNNLKLTDIRDKIINTKDLKIKIIQKILNKNHYQNVKINRIMFIMKNFTGQQFGLILKDWTPVIKLKNSSGNAPIALFTPKVDLEK